MSRSTCTEGTELEVHQGSQNSKANEILWRQVSRHIRSVAVVTGSRLPYRPAHFRLLRAILAPPCVMCETFLSVLPLTVCSAHGTGWGEASSAGEVDSTYFLIGYAIINSATASTTLLNEMFGIAASMSASRSLFRQLLTRVVHAPLRWFDIVPLGTISNRFTNDVSAIDDDVARNVVSLATSAELGMRRC